VSHAETGRIRRAAVTTEPVTSGPDEPGPLRDAQTALTRERLLNAAFRSLAEGGGEGLTVRSVAARAGVSVPTAYRYFSSRDELIEAVGTYINELSRVMERTMSIEDWASYAPAFFRTLEANPTLVRAMIAYPTGREVRSRGLSNRMDGMRTSLREALPDASAEATEAAAALVHLLVSLGAWSHLHDRWGLSGGQAGAAIGWAVRVLADALRRDPEAIVRERPSAEEAEILGVRPGGEEKEP
jgi:AcrR family transcriptional regulator